MLYNTHTIWKGLLQFNLKIINFVFILEKKTYVPLVYTQF